MNPQTQIPNNNIVSTTTLSGNTSVTVRHQDGTPSVPVAPQVFLDPEVQALIQEASGGFWGEPVQYSAERTFYGGSNGQPWYQHDGVAVVLAILAVLLVPYAIVKVLGFVTGTVGFVLRMLWGLITLPFRIVWWALRTVFSIPRRILGLGRSGVVGAGRVVGGTYSAFAQGFNDQEGRQLALDKARRHVSHARERVTKLRESGAGKGAMTRARARVLHARERMQKILDSDVPTRAVQGLRRNMERARRNVESAGRRVGQRLSHLGVDSAEGQGPWVDPSLGKSSHGFHTQTNEAGIPFFQGYQVESELPRGGSGARLFLAQPTPSHARRLSERGTRLPAKVVIKSFSLTGGAHMSGILREGRALDAAKQLGQVLEHVSGDDGLFYVMPFVPGKTLDEYIARLHGFDKNRGLDRVQEDKPLGRKELEEVLTLQLDLLIELERFHDHGLWHKDVKPGNLIVDKGRLRVVDLGLLTPLASALTLTTHGTEYYRDPEMVRLAMRGAQVRDVEAAKFDLYSAGAVLFSMLEGTFPAHGNLSRLTRPCPPALAWVVRRAMSEHDSRYASARAMRADVAFLLEHKDLDAIKPKHLPSWGAQARGQEAADIATDERAQVEPLFAGLQAASVQSEMEEHESLVEEPKARRGWRGKHGRAERAKRKRGSGKAALWLFGSAVLMFLLMAKDQRRHSHTTYAQAELAEQMVAPAMQSVPLGFLHQLDKDQQVRWARKQAKPLFGVSGAGELRKVYLHGLPVGADGQVIAQRVGEALASRGIEVATFDPMQNPDESSLALEAEASRLMGLLPSEGGFNSVEEEARLRFFLDHQGVQAVMDFGGSGEVRPARAVLSPLLGKFEHSTVDREAQ